MGFLFKTLIKWAAVAGTLLLIAHYIPGITVDGWYTACIIALLWGVITLFVRPILSILTLPVNILTLGLFSFVLNAFLFWFVGSFVQGFHVAGFVPALEGSFILSVALWVIHKSL